MGCLKVKIIPTSSSWWCLQLFVNDEYKETLYLNNLQMIEAEKMVRNRSLIFLHLKEESVVGTFSKYLLKNIGFQVEHIVG